MRPSVLKRMVLALILCLCIGTARAEDVLVFAAASATNAVTEIGDLFAAKGLGHIKASFASSSVLAKQIEQGAPASVFLSADVQWVDYLADRHFLAPGSRSDLLANTVVLIAPTESTQSPVALDRPGGDLTALVGAARIATGDPDHVPVGIYAKQALEKLGVWTQVEPHLARTDSVRSALAFVERGEAPLGIVYATDAMISKKVRIVGTFGATLHDPVRYPVALIVEHDTVDAKAFLDFMKGPEARGIFAKYGFAAP